MTTERTSSHDDSHAHVDPIDLSQALHSLCMATAFSMGTPLPRPASFLDLPGELRNEVYPHALQYDNERRLSLKLKASASGKAYVKEPTPSLCYAVPLMWKEVLSVYYAQNRFRIPVVSPKQREAFRTWVRYRGQLLKELTSLKLAWKVLYHYPYGEKYGRKLSSILRLTITADGQLAVQHSSNLFSGCGCYLVPLVEEDWKQIEPDDTDTGHLIGQEEGQDVSEVNPVVGFALKFCRVLDFAGNRYLGPKKVGLFGTSSTDPCARCGERAYASRF